MPPKIFLAKIANSAATDGGTDYLVLYHRFFFCLTFKIDDVPAHLIKQTVGLRWAGMWVRENRTKARSADCGFSNPVAARTGGGALIVC